MAEDPDTKAKRRRRIKESFPPPLNEIALRHVDSVQALSEFQRSILASTLQRIGVRYLVNCLIALKNQGMSIQDEATLIGYVEGSQLPANIPLVEDEEGISEDADFLAKLLTTCYPDMPVSSANALVASEVMAGALCVVIATRRALEDAKSDFVISALFTLFEERLNAIKQTINSNPAFVKAIQHSHPDWNTKN
ncbi:MAG TPA: hypothetical protein VHP14_17865 [Anaerolineales bacterium]|nr:hypothetical protein [Anaerolineales bacterium]